MCGLWVSLIRNFASNAEAGQQSCWNQSLAALDAVALRGPNDARLERIETPAGQLHLGHRRLAIYDTTQKGSQPMRYGSLTVVFNGGLYDFKDIRTQLETMGDVFETQTDTEVLLHAWLKWGSACLTRFDGMFAGALYDARGHTLHLFRDRHGEKPLHILSNDKGFAAASEIGQFKAASHLIAPKIDRDTVKDFLDTGLAESGTRTFFADVSRLMPGTERVYDLSGTTATLRAQRNLWPPLPNAPDKSLQDPRTAARAVADALDISVKRRLAADVTVGACLSGGLDSSAIVRMSARHITQSLHCFCAVFDENDLHGKNLSERPYAIEAANAAHLQLHFTAPTEADLASQLNRVLKRQGEPFAHTSIIAQAQVFEAASSQGIKVMLDGQGADELFGGYAGMLGHRLVDILRQEGFSAWKDAVGAFGSPGSDLDEAALKRATFNAGVPEGIRRSLAKLRGRWPQPWQMTSGEMMAEPKPHKGLSRFEGLMRDLVSERSLPGLLRYEDRNAMTFGIETRLPFLSREVTELAAILPGSVKARDGWTKAVLRDGVADLVPEAIVRRRNKLGFITPQDRWMAGPLFDWSQAGISFAKARLGDLLRGDVVAKVVASIGNNAEANGAGFRLACVGHWAELNNATLD
jgi:asparagine synthase (glutamine-hydrolysing)